MTPSSPFNPRKRATSMRDALKRLFQKARPLPQHRHSFEDVHSLGLSQASSDDLSLSGDIKPPPTRDSSVFDPYEGAYLPELKQPRGSLEIIKDMWRTSMNTLRPRHSIQVDGDVYSFDRPRTAYAYSKHVEEFKCDAKHVILKNLLKSNYLAPLNGRELFTVLDAGAGSGFWCIDMALKFPKTRFIACDQSPIDLPYEMIPRNVLFERLDLCQPLPYMQAAFDFIHHRDVFDTIAQENWLKILKEYARVLRPFSGVLELSELDTLCRDVGPVGTFFNETQVLVGARDSVHKNWFELLTPLLNEAGFTEIAMHVVRLPVGHHAGKVGGMVWDLVKERVIHATSLAVRLGTVSQAIVDDHLDQWEAECKQHQTYLNAYYYIARRQ